MLNSDTFWALVALIIFVGIIIAVGGPGMIARALDGRTNRIRTELDEARKAREEAQALLAEYQRRRRDAEAEAQSIVEEARKEARRLTEEANEKLRDMVERRTKSAEAKIAQAEAHATAEIRGRASELAIAAATDILKARVAGATADRLVSDSIETVRQRLN
ncbi:F0F1 ATP synthase subunit B family protein [Acuticoccus yangtzensis]|uniref:F0F1 ATP synthase subunit B family protein n=1 Tax=Acuticoccus yangtzensis TaxID=1443441 RepID=UPI0009498E51|nr:ATP F0F1 synthase subunit B [Acuticoccus yangtzensis]ORE96110.1 F0F1 ATP synthase subunit B [Stappia sp. 22II-S9-Z10]